MTSEQHVRCLLKQLPKCRRCGSVLDVDNVAFAGSDESGIFLRHTTVTCKHKNRIEVGDSISQADAFIASCKKEV